MENDHNRYSQIVFNLLFRKSSVTEHLSEYQNLIIQIIPTSVKIPLPFL